MLELVALQSPRSQLVYLLRYDTVMRAFPGEITYDKSAETIDRAGWEAIAADQAGDETAPPQPSWEQARDARKMTQRQALFTATIYLVMWHCSQPIVYLVMLYYYKCYVASAGLEMLL